MGTGLQTTPVIDGEVVEVEVSSALAQLNSSEIDIQIRTANAYPRSITTFKRQVLEMATADEKTASGMFYKLPRGGKMIEGPSVRLAEVAASSYKHLRFGSRIISIEQKIVTAQGYCFDLENNIAVAVETQRRITKKDGTRYDDDMIQIACAAAKSIALREAVFKIIPRAYINEAYEQAKLTSLGKGKTMSERRQSMLEWWQKKGATPEVVFSAIGVKGVDDLGNEELITLNGLATAVKDGEITFETAMRPFGQDEKSPGAKVGTSTLNEKLKAKATAKAEAKAETKAEPASEPEEVFTNLRERLNHCHNSQDFEQLRDEFISGPEALEDNDFREQGLTLIEKRLADFKAESKKQK